MVSSISAVERELDDYSVERDVFGHVEERYFVLLGGKNGVGEDLWVGVDDAVCM